MKMIYFMSIPMSIMFILFSHPLILALIIILQSLLICLLINLTMMNSWIAYILFMIFLGGVMILFMYICSLTSNEKIFSKLNQSQLNKMFIFMLLTMLVIDFKKPINIMFKSNFYNMFNKMFFLSTLMTMTYLLLVLIILVKMINITMGPLRTTKNM